MIKESSNIIFSFINNNPYKRQFNTNINDEFNVMGKIEQLFQGELVAFSSNELFIIKKIIKIFDFICFPDFIKNYEFGKEKDDFKKYKLIIDKETFLQFLQNIPKSVRIKTKKATYFCNKVGVSSSNAIYSSIQNSKSLKFEYIYDFDDKNNEFNIICDFLNYQSIRITPKNFQIIKKISFDLQIDCLIQIVDEYNNNYMHITQVLNDNRQMINAIDELTELLYNKKHLNIETVKDLIVNSIWTQNETNIQEFSAYFYQAIRTDFNSHPFLINLMVLLDQVSIQKVYLKKFKPLLVQTCLEKGLQNIGNS